MRNAPERFRGITCHMNVGELIATTGTIDLLDADILLAHVLKCNRETIYAHPEKKVSPTQLNTYRRFVRRRSQGEPLAYVVGQKEFYGLGFCVTPAVLIPRPDTELLVDAVLADVRATFSGKRRRIPTIVDIGTGSGNIAVAIAHTYPRCRMLATDLSKPALRVARKNARRHSASITFFQGDVLAALPATYKGRLDYIVCNAPYLTKNEAHKKNLAYEPALALSAPGQPTEIIARLLKQAPLWLAPNGKVFLEIGYRQTPQIKRLCRRFLPNGCITVRKDYGGFDRLVHIDLKQSAH